MRYWIGRVVRIGIERIVDSFASEWMAIYKDKGALLILFVAVWIYPMVYSVAYQNNVVRDIPMVVVDQDKSVTSRQLIRMIGATQEIKIEQVSSDFTEARQNFWDDEAKGIVVVPAGFEKQIIKGEQTHIGLYCDAGFFLLYKETLRGTLRATGTLSAGIEIKRLLAKGIPMEAAVKQREPMVLKSYALHNPSGAYGSYLMPGLILIILQQTLLVGIGMIGGAKRERQLFQIASTEHDISAILCHLTGKSLAYFTLSIFNLLFTEIVLFQWFGFPDKGALLDLFVLMIPYLFSVIFLGLSVSLLMKRREHSIMLLVFLSPIILFLSGMSWPATSLPPFLYHMALIFPSTSMIPAFLRIRTMGGALSDVRPEFIFMVVQTMGYGTFAMVSYKIHFHRQRKNYLSLSSNNPSVPM